MNIKAIATQITLGTAAFAGVVSDAGAQTAHEVINNIPQAPDNKYIYGILASGLIQIILRIVDKIDSRRKAKKEAAESLKV
jgi:uncharacterized BrkB/YihY/UPF0761 family membrane protein